jgi:hypothetical protein
MGAEAALFTEHIGLQENRAPMVFIDEYPIPINQSLTVNTLGLWLNDNDPDGGQ